MTHTHERGGRPLAPIQDIYYVMFRHKWTIILTSILGLLVAVALFVLARPVYLSEAALLIRYVADDMADDPAAMGGRVLSPDRYGRNVINTQMQLLSSADLASKVLEDPTVVDLASSARPWFGERVLSNLAARVGLNIAARSGDQRGPRLTPYAVLTGLTIENPRNTNIIQLRYRASDPALAQRILSGWIDAYLQKHLEIYRGEGSYEYLAQQMDRARSRLEETEEALRTAKNEIRIDSIEEGKNTLRVRIAALEVNLWKSEAELASALARRDTLVGAMGDGAASDPPAAPAGDGSGPEQGGAAAASEGSLALGRVKDRLDGLHEREQALLQTYTEASAPVQEIRRTIAELEKLVGTNAVAKLPLLLRDAKASNSDELRALLLAEVSDVAALKASVTSLTNQLVLVRREEDRLKVAEARIVALQRKKEIDEANYRYFSQHLEQARIDEALDDSQKISNIKVVQPPTAPAGMLRPNVYGKIAAALCLGIFSGVGLAFFREKIVRSPFGRPRDLELAVSAPVMLSIPFARAPRHFLMGRRNSDTVRLLPAHEGSEEPEGREQRQWKNRTWTVQDHLRAYYEALRDRLLWSIGTSHTTPHLVGVTSCLEGSGVTTAVGGLALTLARNGDGRVLLIDASDLDHGSANRLWGSGLSAGLVDITTDGKGATTILQPNLFVLSACQVDDSLPKASRGKGFEDLLAFIRESKYDFALFDLPPVSETSLALRMSGLLDSIILIIEAEKVQQGTARKAQQLLSRANANLIGTVLNKQRTYVPQWLHAED